MKQAIFLSIFLLALAACNSQGQKRTKTVQAEPDKKEKTAVETKDLTKNSVPERPVEPELPRMEKTIKFIPPVVTDDYVPDVPPQQDVRKDEKLETQEGSEDYRTKSPPPMDVPEPPRVLSIVDESPEFPGGKAGLQNYFEKNLVYPQENSEGKVFVKFVVASDGSVYDVRIIKGMSDCPQCAKEAQRVIKNMPKWTPGKVNGKVVDSYFTLPVSFKAT